MKKRSAGLIASALVAISLPAHSQSTIVNNDLLTTSGTGSGWQECGSGNSIVDLSEFGAGGCAYHEFLALPETEYELTCAGTSLKFASISLAFSDADYNQLDSDTYEIHGDQSGSYSVVLTAPVNTAVGAIGIYADHGTAFQDCVVLETVPTPEPTLGSIAGNVWFDENSNSVIEATESPIPTTSVTLWQNGLAIDTTTTDSQGDYYFGQLDPTLTYTVEFTPADGSLQLSPMANDNDADPASGQSTDITLSETSPNVIGIDAGFMPIPVVVAPRDYTVCGIAWVDENANDSYGSRDSVLSNVSVTLLNTATNDTSIVTTDDLGSFVFDGLDSGDYQLIYDLPTGLEYVMSDGSASATGSFANSDNGQSSSFNLPADSNSLSPNDPCTLRDANVGFFSPPTAIDPTIANDDAIAGVVGESLEIEMLDNDELCGNTGDADLLGHNVPGTVVYDAVSKTFKINSTTASGTYSIQYGARGECGSYDTAEIIVTLTDPQLASDSPTFNKCVFGRAREIVEFLEFEPNTTNSVLSAFNPPVSVVADCGLDLTAGMGWLQGGPETLNSVSPTPVSYRTNNNNYTYGAVYDENMQASCPVIRQITITNADGSTYDKKCRVVRSPIGLDLDGSGQVDRIEGEFTFDIDGDGISDKLSHWFGTGEGILVDGSFTGLITGEHLFGDLGGLYADGFEKLAKLDKNHDGEVAGAEAGTLAIWIDANSNAVLDDGELFSLNDFSIVGLSTTHEHFKSTARLKDGSLMQTEDLWFPVEAETISLSNPMMTNGGVRK